MVRCMQPLVVVGSLLPKSSHKVRLPLFSHSLNAYFFFSVLYVYHWKKHSGKNHVKLCNKCGFHSNKYYPVLYTVRLYLCSSIWLVAMRSSAKSKTKKGKKNTKECFAGRKWHGLWTIPCATFKHRQRNFETVLNFRRPFISFGKFSESVCLLFLFALLFFFSEYIVFEWH